MFNIDCPSRLIHAVYDVNNLQIFCRKTFVIMKSYLCVETFIFRILTKFKRSLKCEASSVKSRWKLWKCKKLDALFKYIFLIYFYTNSKCSRVTRVKKLDCWGPKNPISHFNIYLRLFISKSNNITIHCSFV